MNEGSCTITATERPDGSMDVLISLEGVRAWHVGNGDFKIYEMIGKVPFRVEHLGMTMRPHIVLKMTSRLNASKARRVLWGAMRRQSQTRDGRNREVLVDDVSQNPKAIDHAD